jgi:hypothetical protein
MNEVTFISHKKNIPGNLGISKERAHEIHLKAIYSLKKLDTNTESMEYLIKDLNPNEVVFAIYTFASIKVRGEVMSEIIDSMNKKEALIIPTAIVVNRLIDLFNDDVTHLKNDVEEYENILKGTKPEEIVLDKIPVWKFWKHF